MPETSDRSNRPVGPPPPGPLNPNPAGPPANPVLGETEQTAFPAEGAPGQPVVQVNVEEDMRIGGGSEPVNLTATDHYGLARRRTAAMVAVAIVVAVVLALPVIWGLVELVALAGILGPWVWVWGLLLIALVVAIVVFGYRIVQSSF